MDPSLLVGGVILFVAGLLLVLYVLCWLGNCCRAKNPTLLSSVELAEATDYLHQKNVSCERLDEKRNHYSIQLLQQAINLATRAVEEDTNTNGSYENAITLYDESVAVFTQLANDESISERVRDAYREKCASYADRAKDLRAFLNSNEILCLLDKAIGLLTNATEEDKNRNYREATRLYEEGMTIFSNILEGDDVGQAAKDKIREKYQQYDERVNKIKKYLEEKERKEEKEHMEAFNEFVVEATEAEQNEEYLKALHSYEHACHVFTKVMSVKDLSQLTMSAALSKYDECNEKVVSIANYLLEHPTLTSLDRVNAVMQKAIDEDEKQNYQEAQRLYEESFHIWSYLMRDYTTKLSCHTKYVQYHEAVAKLICKNLGELIWDEDYGDKFKLFHIKTISIKAMKEDDDDNHQEAIKLYRKVLEYYTKLLVEETFPQTVTNRMRKRCEFYKERAEYLEDLLQD